MNAKMKFVPRKRRLLRLPLRRFVGNRNVKDRLFCYIFEQDREALLQLYNALNHTKYRDAQALQIGISFSNINYGHNRNLTASCGRLDEYSRFVDCLKAYRQKGCSVNQAVENAVTYCIDHGIMVDNYRKQMRLPIIECGAKECAFYRKPRDCFR